MTTRVRSKTVTFVSPFNLDEIDRELPAGAYLVETEEEALDGVNFRAYRWVGTNIFVRPPDHGGAAEMWAIHPDSLARAVAKDSAIAD